VHPVEHDREFLVVHAVARERDGGRLGPGVLAEVSLPGLLVQAQDDVGRAQGVQQGPVVDVLDGVVGPVVAAPALHAQQVAALVEVAAEELPAGRRVGPEQLPLQQGPVRRRHGRVNGDQGLLGPQAWDAQPARNREGAEKQVDPELHVPLTSWCDRTGVAAPAADLR
jgi:hypothetical protein